MSDDIPRDDPPSRDRATARDILRWIALLPAAMMASWLLRGAGPFFLSLGGMLDLRGPGYPVFLFPLAMYLPSGAAFTGVGGLTAPRRQIAVAAILAAVVIVLSVLRHVVLPVNPGLTNYLDATGELLGAILGVVVVYLVRSRRRAVA